MITRDSQSHLKRFRPFFQFVVLLLQLVKAMQQRGDVEMLRFVHHELVAEIPMLFQQLIQGSGKPTGSRVTVAAIMAAARSFKVIAVLLIKIIDVPSRRRQRTNVVTLLLVLLVRLRLLLLRLTRVQQ